MCVKDDSLSSLPVPDIHSVPHFPIGRWGKVKMMEMLFRF